MKKVLVLSAVLPNDKETVLLGVYSDFDKLSAAVTEWKTDNKGYWLYFDVVDVDGEPVWTNQQRGI